MTSYGLKCWLLPLLSTIILNGFNAKPIIIGKGDLLMAYEKDALAADEAQGHRQTPADQGFQLPEIIGGRPVKMIGDNHLRGGHGRRVDSKIPAGHKPSGRRNQQAAVNSKPRGRDRERNEFIEPRAAVKPASGRRNRDPAPVQHRSRRNRHQEPEYEEELDDVMQRLGHRTPAPETPRARQQHRAPRQPRQYNQEEELYEEAPQLYYDEFAPLSPQRRGRAQGYQAPIGYEAEYNVDPYQQEYGYEQYEMEYDQYQQMPVPEPVQPIQARRQHRQAQPQRHNQPQQQYMDYEEPVAYGMYDQGAAGGRRIAEPIDRTAGHRGGARQQQWAEEPQRVANRQYPIQNDYPVGNEWEMYHNEEEYDLVVDEDYYAKLPARQRRTKGTRRAAAEQAAAPMKPRNEQQIMEEAMRLLQQGGGQVLHQLDANSDQLADGSVVLANQDADFLVPSRQARHRRPARVDLDLKMPEHLRGQHHESLDESNDEIDSGSIFVPFPMWMDYANQIAEPSSGDLRFNIPGPQEPSLNVISPVGNQENS